VTPGDISVCIVSWNVQADLARCLASLFEDPQACAAEVIVVDNASTDSTLQLLARDYPQVALLANDTNRGFAAASNQALRCATGRYLLLLNPDTLVPSGALAELVTAADAHPAAGIIGPKLPQPRWLAAVLLPRLSDDQGGYLPQHPPRPAAARLPV